MFEPQRRWHAHDDRVEGQHRVPRRSGRDRSATRSERVDLRWRRGPLAEVEERSHHERPRASVLGSWVDHFAIVSDGIFEPPVPGERVGQVEPQVDVIRRELYRPGHRLEGRAGLSACEIDHAEVPAYAGANPGSAAIACRRSDSAAASSRASTASRLPVERLRRRSQRPLALGKDGPDRSDGGALCGGGSRG